MKIEAQKLKELNLTWLVNFVPLDKILKPHEQARIKRLVARVWKEHGGR